MGCENDGKPTGPKMKSLCHGNLILTGGGQGGLAAQVEAVLQSLQDHGAGPEALALIRVFYRPPRDEGQLRRDLAALLPDGVRLALTLVPVPQAGAGDGALCLEAMAVLGPDIALNGAIGGEARFCKGVRRGRFLFLSAETAADVKGLPEESHALMQRLGQTLAALGADFGDVVRMNRWYHAAGSKEEWAPSARATAAFYREPGPVATAISLPWLLPEGRSIQIELMGMRGVDGSVLPKHHAWPDGLWDWPIPLPYKHGLACGGLGFVGGQVSLDAQAEVIDPDHLDRQIARSLANVAKVAAGLGRVERMLHLGCYYQVPPGGVAGAATLRALAEGETPAVLAGFDYLSYPEMRVEIEAIVALRA